MNILYLTDRLSHRGGAPHHLLDVIQSMAANHPVVVAAANKDSDVHLPESVTYERISGLRSNTAKTSGLDRLDPLFAWADLIHIQNVMNPEALARATKRPSLVTIQDHRVFCPGPGKTLPSGIACQETMSETLCTTCIPEADHRTYMLTQTKARLQAIQQAEKVVVLSQYMATALHQVGLNKTSVIPPPVPIGPPKTEPGHGFLIAGRIVKHKAPDVAYSAWKLSGTDHPIKIAGLGSEKHRFADAQDLGWLSREALKTEMASARAVLFPARWQEPFGIVGVESLSVGTPVIATPTGGMADWCNEGCVSVNTIDEMVSAIRHLSDHPDAALALGQAGARAVQAKFAPQSTHKKLNSIYQQIATA